MGRAYDSLDNNEEGRLPQMEYKRMFASKLSTTSESIDIFRQTIKYNRVVNPFMTNITLK